MRTLLALGLLLACGEPVTVIVFDTGDTGAEPIDLDGDGFDSRSDCNDERSEVYPGAPEDCDGLDNDCDGDVDEDATRTYYRDLDGDGFGDPDTSSEECAQPSGWVPNDEDCEDRTAEINPGAEDICNDLDDDCDGEVDEAGATAWYPDGDGDGWGVSGGDSIVTCDPPDGYASAEGDCDDDAAAIHPTAAELCDDIDNDCDGDVDADDAELADARIWYTDGDGDGFGDPATESVGCEVPEGAVEAGGDCDDTDPSRHPETPWYVDVDGDGHGSEDDAILACDQPSGTVAEGDDCDDTDADIHPDAAEVCDGTDNDCDGDTDDADDVVEDTATWYIDGDGDGYGDARASTEACVQPAGWAATDDDCDDTETEIHPDAAETCDGEDNDCDGSVDEGCS